MITYLDASFVVSLYTIDADSASATAAIATCAGPPILSALCQTEVVNAFGLQAFRKEVTLARTNFSIKNFEDDMRSGVYQIKSLPNEIFRRAHHVSRMYTASLGIRTADLLHVVAALELGANTIFSFDLKQRQLASAVGLILNPMP